MRVLSTTETELSGDEQRAVVAYVKKLLDRDTYDKLKSSEGKLAVAATDVAATLEEMAVAPHLVDGVVYLVMNDAMWRHAKADVMAEKLVPLEGDDNALFAASGMYWHADRPQIDIVRVQMS